MDYIDLQSWWHRLGRKMQHDIICCLDLPYHGYFELDTPSVQAAYSFWKECQE